MRIAIIEDDGVQGELVNGWLSADGHRCQTYTDARAFMRYFQRESFDLLVVEWDLPEMSGPDIVRWVREKADWQIPVLFVTNHGSEQDFVRALELGADDYMTKPVSREMLVARIGALCRRMGAGATKVPVLKMGAYEIDTQQRQISRKGQAVPLSEKEYSLAVLFFHNTGRLLSRDHILETVWGIRPGIPTRTVDTHVSRLRQKLGLKPEHGWRLKGVYHHGYRLDQMVREEALTETS